jgi:L-asparagine oxygenase
MESTNIYALTEGQRQMVEAAICAQVPPYCTSMFEPFINGCRTAAKQLPQSIYKWRDAVVEADFGLLRNLPLDSEMPATPLVRYAADSLSMLADSVIATVGTLFGEVYNIEGKARGRHIHNIYPIKADESTQLGSSKVDLVWHVEEAFHVGRPTWLALFCLRSDAEAVTRIARARDLDLPANVTSALRECRFELQVDETYALDGQPGSVISPVLSGAADSPEIVLDPAYTVFRDSVEQTAVSAVLKAAEAAHHNFRLREGDLLLFNNRRTIHARTAYQPRMDGSDRWLKRVFILSPPALTAHLLSGIMPFHFAE